MNEINAAICEDVFGWTVINREKRIYLESKVQAGPGKRCPDFLVSAQAQETLRAQMEQRGFSLEITANPVNEKEKLGKTFTAVFTKGRNRFEQTEPAENLAVCRAALKAVRGSKGQ